MSKFTDYILSEQYIEVIIPFFLDLKDTLGSRRMVTVLQPKIPLGEGSTSSTVQLYPSFYKPIILLKSCKKAKKQTWNCFGALF